VWQEEELYMRAIYFDKVLLRMGSGSRPKKDKLEKECLEREMLEKEVVVEATTKKERLKKEAKALWF
jgi:hypothetical protein